MYLNLGMLRPYKGIENLLEIWRKNKAVFQKDTLLIAGKPMDEAYEVKLTQLIRELKGAILYPKFVENSRINLFFSAADVVVLPFTNILNSGSLILAMSYGKPVVAPRLGGIVETLEEADWLLYDPEDKEGLLKALIKSTEIDLDCLSKLVVEACDRLNWDKIGEETLKVYLALLK